MYERYSSHQGHLKEEIAMRRCSYLAIFLIGLGLLSFTGSAQVEALEGLVLTDLQLISQESLPHWTPAWTGPIQGATIAAWFAENGYPALIHDFNGDGMIDELDTIELANDFGLGNMQTETQRGTTDVRLVVGLATYVASNYPDEFVLKIYDLGFPTEFAAQGYGTFAPDVIPGIILERMEEPSIASYIHELSTGEGVIVGLEDGEVGRNRYLAGRSFLSEPTYEGYTPLDFAWAQEDRWTPGHQGQVLETVGKMEDRFYLDFQGNWTPVEFMLALSPIDEGVATGETCPDLTIRVLDDSCVYDPRGQVYNITVWAEVVNVGTQPVTEPFLVVLNSTTHPGGAVQLIPPVLNPGDSVSVTLSFSTPPDPSGAAPCPLTYVIEVDARDNIDECDEENNTASGEVCCGDEPPVGSCCFADGSCSSVMTAQECETEGGTEFHAGENCDFIECPVAVGACCLPDGSCAELTAAQCEARDGTQFHPGVDCSVVQCPQPVDECPDLVLSVADIDCDCDPRKQTCDVTITLLVSNIGTQAITDPIWLEAETSAGSGMKVIHTDLDPGESVEVEFDFGTNPNSPCVQVDFEIDYIHFIDECNEYNNTLSVAECCN
jgi:CARDB